jgi:hypothetical protein
LKRFLSDFDEVVKDKPDDFDVVKFHSEFEFTREFPIGKEKSTGKREIILKKKDVVPVIDVIKKETKSFSKMAMSQKVQLPE